MKNINKDGVRGEGSVFNKNLFHYTTLVIGFPHGMNSNAFGSISIQYTSGIMIYKI